MLQEKKPEKFPLHPWLIPNVHMCMAYQRTSGKWQTGEQRLQRLRGAEETLELWSNQHGEIMVDLPSH